MAFNLDFRAENCGLLLEDAQRVEAFAPRYSRSHVFLRAEALPPIGGYYTKGP